MKYILASVTLIVSSILYAEEYTASLEWAHRYNASIPLTGVIKNVTVSAGQTVQKGETLITLDNRPYRAAVDVHKASIQNLQGTYDEVNRNYARSKELFDRTVLSSSEMQQAEVDLSIAEANLARAKASLERAQVELSYTTIKAPFTGTVLSRHTNPGEAISLDTMKTLLTLVKTDQFIVRFWVPEKSLSEFSTGQKIELTSTPERQQITITSVGLAYRADTEGKLFAVEGTMTTNGNKLLPGMQATITTP